MVEIVDKNMTKIQMDAPLTFQAYLLDKNDGKVKQFLGEVESKSAAVFRKLVVTEKFEDACIAIRVKDRDDITQFTQDITLKSRKHKDLRTKKFKSLEIEA